MKKSDKAALSSLNSDSAADNADDNDSDEVSEKLVKQIASSINSYSLEKEANSSRAAAAEAATKKQSNGGGESAGEDVSKVAVVAAQQPSINDEISSFSDESDDEWIKNKLQGTRCRSNYKIYNHNHPVRGTWKLYN